jgi:phytoene dehydrogenase-like protein
VAESIASAARELGATIRENATVQQVIVRGGRAVGVVLEDGEEIKARTIVSGLDPRRTFLSLVDEADLPQDFVRSIRRYRSVGSSGKVNLALSELPNFTCLPGDGDHLRGAMSISPSVDYLERAYDDAKYGEFSSRPYMDVIIPSLIDPGMAPPGKHVMSCFVQYAPFKLNGGWNDEKREAFGDTVIDTLSEYAPNLRSAIIHRQVITPQDMEDEFGLTGGNIFHGELSLQQLFFLRPAPRWAAYRTPVHGLYLCGSGTHPGGGICGGPGRLAALEILKGSAR